MELKFVFLVLTFSSVSCYLCPILSNIHTNLCPIQCDCDMDGGRNRAKCVDQNIVSMDVGVPKSVQVYILSHNVISELDNFCFKESGYTSIQVLILAYNQIFWIGLHAFSGVNNLTHLDLSNNRLRQIPSDLFLDTPQLGALDLSANVFETLRNEPFLMHSNLQILNLNNCRIKSLPDRLFTRLPNLRKLDLSENYMISLTTEVLRPLRRLERLELRNDYWQCNPDFLAIESWIISKRITYEKQCNRKLPKMSEKMISAVTPEKEAVDVNDVWNVIFENNSAIVTPEPTTPMTTLEKFDKEFSSIQAFIIGIEIGLAIGIVGTYIWLRAFCKCGQLDCTRPQTRRQRRRAQRAEGDMRTNLLWSNVINPDLETPPLYRRQLSLPERSQPLPTYGLPGVVEAGLRVDAIRLPIPDRSETPPPPYNECRINI